MITKCVRSDKKMNIQYSVGIDAFIERIKKIRALNCSPSDVGMNNYMCNRLFFNRTNSVKKFL